MTDEAADSSLPVNLDHISRVSAATSLREIVSIKTEHGPMSFRHLAGPYLER
jgi:hypothetical protein